MRRISILVVLAVLAAGQGVAPADRVARGTVIQTTDVVASARTVLLVHSVRRTDTLLPPYVAGLDVRFPAGTRVRATSLPRCTLAKLQTKGLDGCPAGARVGSASITGRTHLDPARVESRATIVNGQRIGSRPTVLMFVRPDRGPSFVAVGKLYGSRRAGVRLELMFPTIKTLLNPEPDVAMSDFVLRLDADFVRAPCRARYRVTSRFLLGEPDLRSSDRARCR